MSRTLRHLFLLALVLGSAVAAQAQSVAGLQGVWEQRLSVQGRLVYLCRVGMDLTPQGYRAKTLDISRDCAHPVRSFNHRFDGQLWTCDSDWRDQGIAKFKMKRVSANRFEGWAYVNGKKYPYLNIWTRK